jgi:hypothetical protein
MAQHNGMAGASAEGISGPDAYVRRFTAESTRKSVSAPPNIAFQPTGWIGTILPSK